MSFEFSTADVGVADLEQVESGVAVASPNVATASPPKRGRGRPKGSTKQTAAASSLGSQAAAPAAGVNGSVQRASRASAIHGELVFDIETVPDYSRFELFGLEPLPDPVSETTREKCPAIEEMLSATIPGMKLLLGKLNPVNEYLDLLAEAETRGKNRDGVQKEIASARAAKNAHANAIEQRRKLMSVTPEYCRVAALGWAGRSGEAVAMVAQDPADERKLLEKFWELVKEHRPLIGFNCLSFDLPVIYCRSIILGVPSSCVLDMKPWGEDVVDLMLRRFPKAGAMGLKDLARLYGIQVPAGDMDGSQVEKMLAEDPEKVAEYCMSDVWVTRELRRLFGGYFCN